MDLFSMNEIMMMAAIFGGIILIIIILTILDFVDSKKEKKKELQEVAATIEMNNSEEIKKDMVENTVNETVNVTMPKPSLEITEEIEILDFDEPVIEMKEEISNNEVIVNPLQEESEEIVRYGETFPKVEEKSNIVVITDEKQRAKEELARLEEELQKDDDFENTITNFEMEQEENAIISYDELLKVSDSLYEQNEVVQYDDGNEPITIDEVIKRFSSSEMVFENTANLDKLNHELGKNDQNLVEVYRNE